VKSRFNYWVILPVLTSLGVATLIGWFIVQMVENTLPIPNTTALAMLIVWTYTLIWAFWGEFRTKTITVSIDGNAISVRRFGGLSKKREYLISDFEGFKISKQYYGARGDLEYLYLMKEGYKAVKISQVYHKNYQELKKAIQSKAADLGYERFSFFHELREIFV
jgi:hypothetical protein